MENGYVSLLSFASYLKLAPDYWIRRTNDNETRAARYPPRSNPWADPSYALIHASIVECHRNLAGALRGTGRGETTGADNLQTLRLVFAAYESARSSTDCPPEKGSTGSLTFHSNLLNLKPTMNLTLLGAGGKMGGRLTANLRPRPEYSIDYVEISDTGRKRLAEQQIEPVEVGQAISRAEVVILAIPDASIGKVTHRSYQSCARAPWFLGWIRPPPTPRLCQSARTLPTSSHTPVIRRFLPTRAPADSESDWFGGRGTLAQSVVCALHHGPEEDYPIGEKLAADMFAPILRLHRITVEQMAILEPAVVESTMLTCVMIMKQAMEEAIKHGVPRQAAWDFCLGHIRTELAIVFGFAGFPVSDGAKRAVEQNMRRIFRDEWRGVISIPALKESVRDICQA